MQNIANENSCEDCAGNPINHRTAYVLSLMSYIMRPLEVGSVHIGKFVDPTLSKIFSPMAPRFFKLLAKLKLGIIDTKPNEEESWKAKCMWEKAARRGINMWKFRPLGGKRGTFIAEYRGNISVFDGLPRPKGPVSKSLVWLDDKGLMRKRFLTHGIPVAHGGVTRTKRNGLKLFEKLTKPVITKPSTGSRSRHTTIHIEDKEEFEKAFASAKELSPWVVVEEELKGMVFRGTMIGGRVAAIMRREPPHVVGDGVHSIRKLIEIENQNPKRKGPIFHEIPMSEDLLNDLRKQKLTLESVPEKNKLVTLGQKVGRTTGASTTDVTDIAHSENIKLLERIYEVVKDPLFGVDFIIGDITRSWKEQNRCGIIECNSMPFIDLHHYPLHGKPRNVAGMLWDIVLPDSAHNDKT